MNRVFKMTSHLVRENGRLYNQDKKIYIDEDKFKKFCLEETYPRWKSHRPVVRLWELINDEWIEITSKYDE